MDWILKRQSKLQDAAWAASTKKSRLSKINCYKNFCEQYQLTPFPCAAPQARIYASFLSDLMSPASVSNYLSALWSHQRSLGFEAYSSDYILSLIIKGIRRLHGSGRPVCHPLSKEELLSMYDLIQGRIQGGGPGGQDSPPPFWGTPKLHKEGKNVARVRAKRPRFST